MNKRDAIVAMLDGKKIRRSTWNISYINMDLHGNILDEFNERSYSFSNAPNESVWEIVKEPMTIEFEVTIDKLKYCAVEQLLVHSKLNKFYGKKAKVKITEVVE